MLNHSQRVCEEQKAQLKDEKRRSAKHQQEMKEQLDWQRAELEELSAELEKGPCRSCIARCKRTMRGRKR